MTTTERRVLAAIATLGRLSQDLAEEGTPESARASEEMHAARVHAQLAALRLYTPLMAAATADGEELPFSLAPFIPLLLAASHAVGGMLT